MRHADHAVQRFAELRHTLAVAEAPEKQDVHLVATPDMGECRPGAGIGHDDDPIGRMGGAASHEVAPDSPQHDDARGALEHGQNAPAEAGALVDPEFGIVGAMQMQHVGDADPAGQCRDLQLARRAAIARRD